jgi:hypothetical protein
MTMPGLYSEVYAEAELRYRRERMLAGVSRMHRRAYPFHWWRRRTEPQSPPDDGGRPVPRRRQAPALYYPHCG